MGLIRHLETSEILDQVYQVNRLLLREGIKSPRPLTNLVFMGMGEPLHNYAHVKRALYLLQHEEGCNFSHRHLTVSTSGIVPEMERLAKETFVKLAVSFNATTNQQRNQLMPVNRRWNIQQLLQACSAFPTRHGRRVTFEYIMLDGVNDSLDDAKRLVQWLKPMTVKVNIIPYNENPGLPFRCSPQRRIEEFQQYLLSHGIATMTRKSRGRDIAAACGQLAMSE
jgi:23S rRNA (adenine2503-C2)-methyltransferase